MPAVPANTEGVMKNKRTLQSLQDAVDGEVARVKIEASAIADKIDANLKHYGEVAAGYEHLFRDLSAIAQQPAEAFGAIVSNRIREHKDAEEKRLAAERERIRAEEEAKAKAKADAEAKTERERRERIANISNAPVGAIGANAAGIARAIVSLSAVEISERTFGDLYAEAGAAKLYAIQRLEEMLAEANAKEASEAAKEANADPMLAHAPPRTATPSSAIKSLDSHAGDAAVMIDFPAPPVRPVIHGQHGTTETIDCLRSMIENELAFMNAAQLQRTLDAIRAIRAASAA